MRAFIEMFPELGERETHVLTVPQKGSHGSLPPDQYAFVESYCDDKGCDCRKVVISVFANNAGRIVATINMGFDAQDADAGPFPDPLSQQSAYSAELINYFVEMINHDSSCLRRLQQHYVMFKEKVDGKPYTGKPFDVPIEIERVVRHPVQSVVREDTSGKPDKKEKIARPSSVTGREIKQAEALVRRAAGRLQKTPGNVIDRQMSDDLGTDPNIVSALVHLLLKVHSPNGSVREMTTAYEACLILVEEGLTQIRYSVDRDRQWAIDAAERIQKEIAATAFQLTVDTRVQADLVQTLHKAGLELHPDIKAKSMELAEYYGRFVARGAPPDMERLFDTLVADGPDNPFELYDHLTAELNLLPVNGQLGIIAEMANTGNMVIRELAAFMLLHPNREVRSQVPIIYTHLVSPDTVSSETLRRMIVLRNWLPEAERSALDQVIRRIRIAHVQCAPMPPVQSVEAYASPFDGSGVQGVWAVSRQEKRYQLAGVLVCQGQGIRDVWGQTDMTKRDVKSMLREIARNGEAHPVESSYVERLISHFVWLGQQQGTPPPPGLLQAAETMGNADWHPRPVVFEKELAALLKAADIQSLTSEHITRVLEKSGDWPEKMQVAASWFEDESRVDDLLKKNIDLSSYSRGLLAQAGDLILREIIEKKRDVWSERLLWMALWSRSCKGRSRLPWQDFLIVARELRQGTPLEEIPLMLAIAVRSVYSAVRRMKEMPE